MSRIVNLRQARKAQGRADRRAEADANAARHGRTKAERGSAAQTGARDARRLDAHRIEGEEP